MLKKIVVITLIFILVLIASFYFWGSSSFDSGMKDAEIITYSEEVPTEDSVFSIMTYNIGYLSGMTNNLSVEMPENLFKDNMEASKQLLKSLDIDVIGFQEIDYGSKRSFEQNQLDILANYLKSHQGYRSINWNKNYVPFPYWPPKFHFGKMLSGQAILSKFPLSNTETIRLEKPKNAPFYYNAFYLDRLIQVSDVQIEGKKVKVISLHLEAFDTETREEQGEIVKKLFEKYANQMPVLLIGDFNSEPSWEPKADKTMKTILSAEGIASAITQNQYEANKKVCYTFDSGNPYQMIDFILYNPKFITPIEARVVREAGQISDHLPVMMKFALK